MHWLKMWSTRRIEALFSERQRRAWAARARTRAKSGQPRPRWPLCAIKRPALRPRTRVVGCCSSSFPDIAIADRFPGTDRTADTAEAHPLPQLHCFVASEATLPSGAHTALLVHAEDNSCTIKCQLLVQFRAAAPTHLHIEYALPQQAPSHPDFLSLLMMASCCVSQGVLSNSDVQRISCRRNLFMPAKIGQEWALCQSSSQSIPSCSALSACQSCLSVRCCCGRKRAGNGHCSAARGWCSRSSSVCSSLAGAEGRAAQQQHVQLLLVMCQIHIEQPKAPRAATGAQSE